MDFNRLGKAASVIFLALAMAGCGGGAGTTTTPETEPPPPDPAIAEREAIKTAIGMAKTAVAAVDNDSTDAEVSAAGAAVTAARSAITAATSVPAQERAANTGTVDVLANRLTAAKTARMAAMDEAAREAAKEAEAARMAMAATAAKLYVGIGPPTGEVWTIPNRRFSRYSGAGIRVLAATGSTPDFNFTLPEDEKAMVAANRGWEGKRYALTNTTTPEGRGVFEAIVYSNVGEPTEGAKFNVQYTLTDGAVSVDTAQTGEPVKVASPSFDQEAGVKSFELPDNTVAVMISGSYHGVDGTYSCVPVAGNTCAARLAAPGFTLGGVTAANVFSQANAAWTFKPADPDARLMNVPDAIYASYGWWTYVSEDGETVYASAFVGDVGEVPDASGIGALQGTATYLGGAAGQYALSSSTGGTNDAGRFTADATLEADFYDNTITGTIDNFMVGADGAARDWSVELKESGVNATGRILGSDGSGDPMQTVWTIDGRAADAAGAWRGTLQDNGDDGVPKVGTGWFYSTYGGEGKMVGGFGVNKQ